MSSNADTSKRIQRSYRAFAAFITGVTDGETMVRASCVLNDPGIKTSDKKNIVIYKKKFIWEKRKFSKMIQGGRVICKMKK